MKTGFLCAFLSVFLLAKTTAQEINATVEITTEGIQETNKQIFVEL